MSAQSNAKKSLLQRLREIGPAAIVTAAFIGPGTVTTCTLAGVQYRYSLLWAMLFSTIAVILLQEMSARVGIVTGGGLGQAIRNSADTPGMRLLAAVLIVGAIGVGNSAFQSGNITGASLGLQVLLGSTKEIWAAVVAVAAFCLLWTGSYKLIEKVLTAMVFLMCALFLITALVIKHDWGELLKGLFIPNVPPQALLVTLGLIGTTVVPYNLFLHSSAAAERWGSSADKRAAIETSWFDIILDIGIGGLISIAIILTASAMHGSVQIKSAADMAKQLEPLLGPWAKWFFALGLFAAGATSAMTAPLAAAYAVSGVLGWPTDLKSFRFRVIWFIVLIVGAFVALTGANPVQVIVFAQAINGVLLPISAIYLIIVMNRAKLMKEFTNTPVQNVLGWIVTGVTIVLGLRLILRAFGIIK